jgi:hypothetical protein
VRKSYHLDCLVYLFYQFRSGCSSDHSNEHDEGTWQPLKKAVHNVPADYLHNTIISNDEIRKSLHIPTKKNKRNDFKFFKSVDQVFLPFNLIKKNGKFHPLFCLAATYMIDSNGENIVTNKNGITFKYERSKQQQSMRQFTVDVEPREMHIQIQQQAELNKFQRIFANKVIIEAVEYGRNEVMKIMGDKFDKVCWWVMIENQWFQSKILIDSILTLKELDGAIRFAKNHQFIMPIEMKENSNSMSRKEKIEDKLRNRKDWLKSLLEENVELWQQFFPSISNESKKYEVKENQIVYISVLEDNSQSEQSINSNNIPRQTASNNTTIINIDDSCQHNSQPIINSINKLLVEKGKFESDLMSFLKL